MTALESLPGGRSCPIDTWVGWRVIHRAMRESCVITGTTGRERVWHSGQGVLWHTVGPQETAMTYRLLDAGWLIPGASGTFDDHGEQVPGRTVAAARHAWHWAIRTAARRGWQV